MPEIQVIHAPGPEPPRRPPAWRGGNHGELEALAGLLRSLVTEAAEAGRVDLDLPALGVEGSGFPAHAAAHRTIQALRDALHAARRVHVVRIWCSDPHVAQVYRDALAANALVRRPTPD